MNFKIHNLSERKCWYLGWRTSGHWGRGNLNQWHICSWGSRQYSGNWPVDNRFSRFSNYIWSAHWSNDI